MHTFEVHLTHPTKIDANTVVEVRASDAGAVHHTAKVLALVRQGYAVGIIVDKTKTPVGA